MGERPQFIRPDVITRGQIERINAAYNYKPTPFKPHVIPAGLSVEQALTIVPRTAITREQKFGIAGTVAQLIFQDTDALFSDVLPALPSYTPEDHEKSIRNMLIATLTHIAGKATGLGGEAYKKASHSSQALDRLVDQYPQAAYLRDVIGGANEGGFLAGLGFSAATEGMPLPQEVKRRMKDFYLPTQALTALTMTPQKLLDGLSLRGIQFTHYADGYVQLKPGILEYLEACGKQVFTNYEIPRHDTNRVRREIQKLFPPNLYPEGVTRGNFDKVEKKGKVDLSAYNAYFDSVTNLYVMSKVDPSIRRTMECPAKHVRVLKPWYDSLTNVYTSWYEREYNRLQAAS